MRSRTIVMREMFSAIGRICELLRDLGGALRKMRTGGNVESWLVRSNARNFRRHERAGRNTKLNTPRWNSHRRWLSWFPAHADGNLKILRIYVSNLTVHFYVRSTLYWQHATIHARRFQASVAR